MISLCTVIETLRPTSTILERCTLSAVRILHECTNRINIINKLWTFANLIANIVQAICLNAIYTHIVQHWKIVNISIRRNWRKQVNSKTLRLQNIRSFIFHHKIVYQWNPFGLDVQPRQVNLSEIFVWQSLHNNHWTADHFHVCKFYFQ